MKNAVAFTFLTLVLAACAARGGREAWSGGSVMSFAAAEQLCRNEARLVLDASRPTVFESCMARNGWRRGAAAR